MTSSKHNYLLRKRKKINIWGFEEPFSQRSSLTNIKLYCEVMVLKQHEIWAVTAAVLGK